MQQQMLGGLFFCRLFFLFSKFIYSFIFPIGCICCWLFLVMLSQILVQVLTLGFGSSIQIFVVFMSNNFYVMLHRNPGHGSSLYDCLLDYMGRVQPVDDRAVFVFVGDVNAHHSEW